MYFHEGRKAWAIADSVGSTSPYAFVPANVPAPGKSRVRLFFLGYRCHLV